MTLQEFYIEKTTIGTPFHIKVKGGSFSPTTDIPEGSFFYSTKGTPHHPRNLLSLIKLSLEQPLEVAPDRYIKMTQGLGCSGHQCWSKILPKKVFQKGIHDIVGIINEIITGDTTTVDYFENIWLNQTVFDTLQAPKISTGRWQQLSEIPSVNYSNLETYFPDKSGLASDLVYNRISTRTGRLIVDSGPRVLTFQKEWRDLIISRFEGGKILSVDFKSLEPMTLLHETRPDVHAPADLYNFIKDEVFSEIDITRKTVKYLVISKLYGMSTKRVIDELGCEPNDAVYYINKINKFFSIDSLINRLRDELNENLTFIRNRYGRKVLIENPSPHILLNSYIQSTGVDVSLLGFSKISETLCRSSKSIPLFMIHDEMIIDAHPDDIDKISRFSKIKVRGYEKEFPLSVKSFYEHSHDN